MTTTPIVSELGRSGDPNCGRAQLARYAVPTEERVLYQQCIDGDVQVIDVPAHGAGRCYSVERDLEQAPVLS